MRGDFKVSKDQRTGARGLREDDPAMFPPRRHRHGGSLMNTIRLLSAALAICCVPGCNDKIAPWTAASSPQSDAGAPKVGQWIAAVSPIRSTRCSLDAVNDHLAGKLATVDSGSPTNFSGWVATVDLKNPLQFTMVLDGQPRDIAISAATSQPRYDVARALGSNALTYAGFRIELPSNALQPGTYRVSIAHRGATGDVTCATPTTLTVR